jgi:hypothetical protein
MRFFMKMLWETRIDPQISLIAEMGTSESFMHHPANDRSVPKAEVNLRISNVC